MRRCTAGAASTNELDRLIQAARDGVTLFGRGEGHGEIEWMLTGSERQMACLLVAEAGLLPGELVTLTPEDFRLDASVPTVTPGPFAAPSRRGIEIPLDGAMRAMLAEFLSEREPGQPVFRLGSVARFEAAVRHDACQAGLAGWDSRRLAMLFAAKLTERDGEWGDDAVEVEA